MAKLAILPSNAWDEYQKWLSQYEVMGKKGERKELKYSMVEEWTKLTPSELRREFAKMISIPGYTVQVRFYAIVRVS